MPRKKQIEANIGNAFDLRSELERRLLLASDPREAAKFSEDIKEIDQITEQFKLQWYNTVEEIAKVKSTRKTS